MVSPVNDDVARGRWLAISLLRIAGAAMVVVGILTVERVVEFPAFVGHVLIAVGLLDVFLVPQFLARKWRSPLE